MNQLIKPAVSLMNRLPMFYKFSLISVLFLLPIVALSWLVISELNRSVETMTKGVEGLEQLEKVDALLQASLEYRDFRAPGKIKDDNELLSRSDEAASTIDSILEELAGAD
ncbi:MAG TPA: methyl-accepting chemotaxis protein, partial [Marinobacter sp.]